MTLRWLLLASLALLLVPLLLVPLPAKACTCTNPRPWAALEAAALVAEVTLVEVREDEQQLRYRVERVFSSRAPIREGQEIWVRHQTCNSLPPSADAVGARLIVFFDGYLGQLVEDYCSLRLSAWSRIPGSLLAARRRWLAERR